MEAEHALNRSRTTATANDADRQFARVVKGVDLRSTEGNFAWAQTPQLTTPPLKSCAERPCRLVVRTSRRGRDNPGSTPGVDIAPPPRRGRSVGESLQIGGTSLQVTLWPSG